MQSLLSIPTLSAMKTPRIRAIAICLFSHGDRILVSEHSDSVKGDRFCRPLGGGIDFGESSQVAMQREIQEEIGAEIENLRFISVIENIFVYEGKPHHEIVFVYDAEFVDKSLYAKPVLHCHEHNHGDFTASWKSVAEMSASDTRLVPPEILPFVQQRSSHETV